MAKKFGKTTVSDDSVELETETADAPNGPGSTPPAKVATAGRPGDGGGRRPSKSAAGPGLFERIGQFLRDTRAEMRRVTWPSLLTVRNTTIITLIAVVFFAVYLFAVDQVWTFLIGNLKSWMGG